MKIDDVTLLRNPLLEAIQARISHPEDLVWQQGAEGITNALCALEYITNNVKSVTIKFDGSPALIFGRDPADGKLVVTDKSGFNAKRYNGLVKSSIALQDMLFNRMPLASGRSEYARQIASLWDLFETMIPADATGYYQGDLMYIGTPPIADDKFQIKPNKILYKVTVDSALGKKIGSSLAGIAIHGFMPDSTSNILPVTAKQLNLLQNNRLIVISPDITLPTIDTSAISLKTAGIGTLLDKQVLRSYKLADFGALIGKYIAYMARTGNNNFDNVDTKFIHWIANNTKLSANKKQNVKAYIDNNVDAVAVLWKAIATIASYKTQIKQIIDTASTKQQDISAFLSGEVGHEGYVATTPHGVIKLVDRHKFMKDTHAS